MNRLVTGGFVAIVCTLLAPACGEEAVVCACDIPFDIAGTVEGTVFTPDSLPAVGARVVLLGGVDSCAVDGHVGVVDGTADGTGAYEAGFHVDGIFEGTVCVVARALPALGSGYAASDTLTLMYDRDDSDRDIVEEHDFYLKPGVP